MDEKAGSHSEKGVVGFYTRFVPSLVFPPVTMASATRIWDYIFWVFLEHLQTHPGSDDSKVMVVNIAGFC